MNLGNIADYIERVLGLEFNPSANGLSEYDDIPYIYRMTFDIAEGVLCGVDCLFVSPAEPSINLSTLFGRVSKLENTAQKPCVLLLDSIDSMTRRQLIARKQSFVVAGKQLYLPFVGTLLSERGLGHREKPRTLSPSSQLVVLYHLQMRSLDGLPLKDLANMMGYSSKTISLVASELSSAGLCEVQSEYANTKSIRFLMGRRQVWDNAYPLMRSPISKVVYAREDMVVQERSMLFSFDQALSHYTDIADAGDRCLAVEKKRFKSAGIFYEASSSFPGSVRIELWKYDPSIMAKDAFVDPLSLALCYKDDDDERVRGEIDRLIERLLW